MLCHFLMFLGSDFGVSIARNEQLLLYIYMLVTSLFGYYEGIYTGCNIQKKYMINTFFIWMI